MTIRSGDPAVAAGDERLLLAKTWLDTDVGAQDVFTIWESVNAVRFPFVLCFHTQLTNSNIVEATCAAVRHCRVAVLAGDAPFSPLHLLFRRAASGEDAVVPAMDAQAQHVPIWIACRVDSRHYEAFQ